MLYVNLVLVRRKSGEDPFPRLYCRFCEPHLGSCALSHLVFGVEEWNRVITILIILLFILEQSQAQRKVV